MSEESKLVNYLKFVGIVGGMVVIISTFLPWFSDNSLYLMYIYSGADSDSFVYFFPIMSGIICVIGSFLYILRPYLKINSVIIELIGLGFNLLFLLDFIANHGAYILNIQFGFYLFVIGLILIFIEIYIKLQQKEEEGPDLTIPEEEEAKMEQAAALKEVAKEKKDE